MSVKRTSGKLNRRRFLRAAGIAAGASLAGPLLAESSAAASSPGAITARPAKHFTVGVLLAQSSLYPALAGSFLNGLQLALAQAGNQLAGRPLALQTQSYGTSPARALSLTRDMLASGQADAIVSLGSSGQAADLDALLAERRVPLIVSGAGANVARANQHSPFLFRSSLGMWRASYALGHWAAGAVGRRAVMLSSFYDSGYDTLYAFRLGFARAGGDVVDQWVTHVPAGGTSLDGALAAARAARPDLVFAAASGPQAVELAHAYARSGLAGRVPLLGSSFFTDEAWLAEQGDAALGAYTAAAWAPGLGTPTNQAFVAAYAGMYGQQPDVFAVLGHDTAGQLVRAGEAGAPLADALHAAAFDGPRGRLAIDPAQRDVATPLYLRAVRRGAGALRNEVISALELVPDEDERLLELRASVKTGWTNAYLSV
jgi:branched-chain amino acid transport system substrate-binding protein